MPQYLISFSARAMDYLPGEDMPAVREWRWPVDVPDSSTRP